MQTNFQYKVKKKKMADGNMMVTDHIIKILIAKKVMSCLIAYYLSIF